MDYTNFINSNSGFGFINGFWLWLTVLVIWSLFWKGWALWRAARREDKAWYVVLLILNTIGILEIIYLFLVTKGKESK